MSRIKKVWGWRPESQIILMEFQKTVKAHKEMCQLLKGADHRYCHIYDYSEYLLMQIKFCAKL